MRYAVTHELCHYYHGDVLWAAVRYFLLSVYWFDPLVWAAAYYSKLDCECACDEAVIKILGEENRIEYGETLLAILHGRKHRFGTADAGMVSGKRALKERIKFISKKTVSKPAAIICSALILAGTCGCAFTSAKTEELSEKAVSEENIPEHSLENTVTYDKDFPAKAEKALYEFVRDPDNYSEYYTRSNNYMDRAKQIYIDPPSFEPDENGEPSAHSVLWLLNYGRNDEYIYIPLNYDKNSDKWIKGAEQGFVGYISSSAKLIDKREYKQAAKEDMKKYTELLKSRGIDPKTNDNYAYFIKNLKDTIPEYTGEATSAMWVEPLFYDENGTAYSRIICESENYVFSWDLRYDYDDFYSGYFSNNDHGHELVRHWRGVQKGMDGTPAEKTPEIIERTERSENIFLLETNGFPVNENGLTYGPSGSAKSLEELPDLISAIGINGKTGYIRNEDYLMMMKGIYPPATYKRELYGKELEEAREQYKKQHEGSDENIDGMRFYMECTDVPLYDESGCNIIDTFMYGGNTKPYSD